MTFGIKGDSFCVDDKKVFLNAGEIHYFRIKRELWNRHLEAAKDAGLTTISTYVPWAWHEPHEAVFDFNGATCPERDLKGWLQRCKALGLTCILKPGPFILAEFRGAGLPVWFLNRYCDEVKMRSRNGAIVQSDGVSLFNQHYLEKVALWYDQVMPVVRNHEISAGGPVIMMQICNEIGVFSWLAKQADYGNWVRDRFIAYLSAKFSGISELNELWGTEYQEFIDVELPPDGITPYGSKGDRSRDVEWHRFWRVYYGDYLRLLAGMARERGVTVPFYHNLPGWIYGHGYEFPVNITMYEELFGEKSDIIFGVDHIPEFVSYRNMHDDRIINDIVFAMQGNKPLFAAEFQSGSREYHVVPNPRETELFCKASIANGLTGWNHYMFSQGRNTERTGHSGETFYWFTPLTAEGERTSAFPLVKRMSRVVKTFENLIVNAKRKAEVCVLFYPPYYATEMERPAGEACELQFPATAIRRPAYFDGLLKALQILNIDYDMSDLTRASPGSLGKYKQVWAFSTDEMDARDQQTMTDYARAGGNLVIFPNLPDREMSQKPCAILRDALSLLPSGSETIDSPLIDILGFPDVKCANPQITYAETSLAGSEIIARTLRGTACGFTKVLGSGSVMHLGTWLGFEAEKHKTVYEEMLKRSGAKLRQASAVSDQIAVRQRFTDNNTALLFVGNYYNEAQTGRVSYMHPETGEPVAMPYTRGEMLWPALYGVLTPVCLELVEGMKILHCTSDILDIAVMNEKVEITLYGDRDLPGEIVFEGSGAHRIKSATLDGEAAELVRVDARVAVMYRHEHEKEMVLCIQN